MALPRARSLNSIYGIIRHFRALLATDRTLLETEKDPTERARIERLLAEQGPMLDELVEKESD
ncbi:MAG: hypothetical protein P8Z80_01000 [Pseudolabrys sp.]